MASKLFIVTAYRWGDQKDHSYPIGVFTSECKAIEAADSHRDYRGYKYACVIDECISDQFENNSCYYTKEIYRAKSVLE